MKMSALVKKDPLASKKGIKIESSIVISKKTEGGPQLVLSTRVTISIINGFTFVDLVEKFEFAGFTTCS